MEPKYEVDKDKERYVYGEYGPYGQMFCYVGDICNSPAFREGFERTFGKRDDIGSNLMKKE